METAQNTEVKKYPNFSGKKVKMLFISEKSLQIDLEDGGQIDLEDGGQITLIGKQLLSGNNRLFNVNDRSLLDDSTISEVKLVQVAQSRNDDAGILPSPVNSANPRGGGLPNVPAIYPFRATAELVISTNKGEFKAYWICDSFAPEIVQLDARVLTVE